MAIDLAQFRLMFPQWQHCTDEQLGLWSDISACLVCVPVACSGLAERLPHLMLAHVLTLNGVQCSDPTADPAAPSACSCDDEYLTQLLNGGAKISSVTIEGISASFDNAGLNSLITSVGTGSPFRAWLAMTQYGQMIAAVLSKVNKGPMMAVGGSGCGGHFVEPIPHTYIPGHG